MGALVHHEFIDHPDNPQNKIEFYWVKPEGKGAYPAKFFIHGHQDSPSAGGKAYVERGVLELAAEHGEVGVAVSQPGYGNSTGPSDYCGPFIQHAVKAVIQFFRKTTSFCRIK